jgi:hypothetical protein
MAWRVNAGRNRGIGRQHLPNYSHRRPSCRGSEVQCADQAEPTVAQASRIVATISIDLSNLADAAKPEIDIEV